MPEILGLLQNQVTNLQATSNEEVKSEEQQRSQRQQEREARRYRMAALNEICSQRAGEVRTGKRLREEEQEQIYDENQTRALRKRNYMSISADLLSENVTQAAKLNAEGER